MEYDLRGILNLESISNLIKKFSDLMKINITLLDKEGNQIIYPQGSCKYCWRISLTDRGDACKKSDINALKIAKETRKPYIYRCYAGMIDMCIPVFVKEELTGVLLAGQIIPDRPDTITPKKIASQFGIPYKELKSYYLKARVLPLREIESIGEFLFAMLNYVIEKEMERISILEERHTTSNIRNKINEITRHIKTHYTQDITRSQLCKDFMISESHFSHTFKKHTGVSFNNYINRLRISSAKTLLETTDKSISEIAFDVGYNDSNYFTATFEKFSGMPPLRYRKNRRKNIISMGKN